MKYFCCDNNRRNDIENHPWLNGIEFLEVIDNTSDPAELRQTILEVHFIKDIVPGSLTKDQVIIEGGDRIKNITVTGIGIGHLDSPLFSPPGNPSRILIVHVSEAGDFSKYTLRLVADKNAAYLVAPAGYDPVLSSIEFSFKISCPSDFDCNTKDPCVKEFPTPPDINYLAKDYASFRQLMLDRMAVLLPSWKERNPSDTGIMLVELLAYAGDYLSYKQDAIATEAYLGTARKRVSIRRHARLVDYRMHDGCNARTWVHIAVKQGINKLKIQRRINEKGSIVTRFLTKATSDLSPVFKSDAKEFTTALGEKVQVFELLHDETLYAAHNTMYFYTWGNKECCLPKGSVSATLAGNFSNLKPGQVLIFQEVKGPQTGDAADADPGHRHPVRLTEIITADDPLYPVSPPGSPPSGTPVTLIKWHSLDALPFPLCISSLQGTRYFENISVALGNNVLVDHGYTIEDSKESSLDPDTVSDSGLTEIIASSTACCEDAATEPVAPRYTPVLKQGPLTFAAPYDYEDTDTSAAEAMKWTIEDALPSIKLYKTDTSGAEEWQPLRDLLNSSGTAKEFVVEMESDGIAHMRFGNDMQGMRPDIGDRFLATYRLGIGRAGNIGLETIGHLVSDDPAITADTIESFTNPVQATGGTEPESMELVRQKAPVAFQKQERAVTSGDYEEMSKRCESTIQRSACTFRWTGSWRTAFLSIDRFGAEDVDREFKNRLRKGIERYRMAGHDIEVNDPRYVSLEIEMEVCVKPDFFASDVKAALSDIFTNRLLPGGRRGIFHPDNFSFGQTVYLSPVYAAAQSVEGVASVQIKTFKRQNDDNNDAIDTGKLLLSRLEIPRLDNDPNYPDRGIFNLVMKGGK